MELPYEMWDNIVKFVKEEKDLKNVCFINKYLYNNYWLPIYKIKIYETITYNNYDVFLKFWNRFEYNNNELFQLNKHFIYSHYFSISNRKSYIYKDYRILFELMYKGKELIKLNKKDLNNKNTYFYLHFFEKIYNPILEIILNNNNNKEITKNLIKTLFNKEVILI